MGVVNTLAKRGQIKQGPALFEKAFEHFLALELRVWLSYSRKKIPLQYWRSTSQFEVDFILGQDLAPEIKSTEMVTDKHPRGLRALAEEGLIKHFAVVSLDPYPRKTEDGSHILPWQTFLDHLCSGQLDPSIRSST